jgi:hypothetical protein
MGEKNGQPGKEKALGKASGIAINRVLSQQKQKHWDSTSHRAAISYLAEAHGMPAKNLVAFRVALAEEPWDYASNMKKRLAASELIPAGVVNEEVYK